ncbi:MAG: hypothetical protein HQK85_05735 [Nitrospinae bacterium]|nr:hypothetical protein [Nitrospinota bacterium]
MSSRTGVALVTLGFILAISGSTFASTVDESAELASIAAVEGANIMIVSPANGARIKAGVESKLAYEVMPGKGGDHFHVWVDDAKGPSIRETKGVYTLPRLSPGDHVISIRIVAKDHSLTGPMRSIKVTADPRL